MTTELCSGLIGAILAQICMIFWYLHRQHKEFEALRMSILAECDYVLSILDEVRDGSLNGRMSFKRLPIDYFRAVHKSLIKYSTDHELFRLVSKVSVDMDVFNREVEFVFAQQQYGKTISGTIGREPVALWKKSEEKDISNVIRNAKQGVYEAIMHMKKYLGDKYGTVVTDEV